MARERGLKVVFSGDTKPLDRAFGQVSKNADHVEKRMDGFGRKVGGAFKLAGAAAAGALVVGLKKSVEAAIEAEKAQARLETQLKASGISYREHGKHIDDVIQKTSRLAGLDDEDLSDAFTNIVRVTGNVNQSLKLTGLAADFARAKHMDVAKAGEIVGKVAGGNVGVLGRYGVTLRKGATATEALGALQQKFAGQAAAYGKTTAGAQDRFRVAVENLQEKIGSALLPTITKVTNRAAKFVDEMSRGVGAGGRFADKLKEIADRIRPIIKFFADHPKLIAVAVGAWVAYRVAASAALVASRLKLIGMFVGLGPRAAAGGVVAGRSFGGAAAASAGTTFNRTAPGRFGKAAAGFTAAGSVLGVALGAAAALELVDQLRHTMAKFYDSLRSKGGIQGVLGAIGKLGTDLAGKVPVIGGRSLEQTLGSRPKSKSKPKTVRPSAGSQAAPDNRPRAHSSSVMAHAASAGPIAHAAASQPHPDDIVAAIEGRADLIDRAHVPYLWGGGHGGRFTGKVIPMDCSGAVSAALGIDPRVSGDFVTWGSPGDGGSSGVTIYANRTHVLMKINGRFWGTSRSNPGGGPGWIQGGVPAGYLSGFTARHMAGATAVTGGTAAPGRPGRPRKPVILSAGLAGRGGSKVSGTRLGTKLPKGATDAYVTPDLPPGTIEALGGDPETNLTSRTMRRFWIGNRIASIDRELRNPRHSLAYRQRLIAERGQLVTEGEGLAKPMAAPEGPTGVEAIPGASAYLSRLDREAAEAELTPNTADDLDVARRRATAAHGIYDYMKSHGFSDTDIASAARDVKSADDTVKGLEGNTDAVADNTAAINALKDEMKRLADNATSTNAVSMAQLARGLADFISGQITGVGYDPRAMTAGAGALARY